MYRALFLLCCVVCLACWAHATPILYLSATTVPSSFDPAAGADPGVFELNGVRPLVIHHPASQDVIDDVSFSLFTYLKTDTSTAGHVEGLFEGGEIRLAQLNDLQNEHDDVILLLGEVRELVMSEFLDDRGMLTATGFFAVRSGSLKPDFAPAGDIFDLVFSIQPRVLEDFGQPFDGYSDVSLAPVIAEPAAVALFGIGLIGFAGRRKRP